jgi:formylglycine-generating enzyme
MTNNPSDGFGVRPRMTGTPAHEWRGLGKDAVASRTDPRRICAGWGIAALALFAAACGGGGNERDAGATDTDTNSDGGMDAGPQPIDPEVDWVGIPAGSFTFGSPETTPCRGAFTENEVPITLTHPFLISKYEITQKQWLDLGFKLPHRAPDCPNCPIDFLNMFEAMVWCNALSRFEGREECYDLSSCSGDIGGGCPDGDFYELNCIFVQDVGTPIDGLYDCASPVRKHASMYDCTGYRLPTGPEWEYAAKAGTTTNTYNGDITDAHGTDCGDEPILNDIAWYCGNTGAGDTDAHPDQLREIGLKQPNPWGLYDMLGNAGEWADYVATGYPLDDNEGKPGQALVDPMGMTEDYSTSRDLRGGWFWRAPCTTRAAAQFDAFARERIAGSGFRPVRTLPATSSDGGVK